MLLYTMDIIVILYTEVGAVSKQKRVYIPFANELN